MNRVQTRRVRNQSRGEDSRAQTEPLAALIAVALFCLAVSVYAGFVTGLVPDLGSERELAEVTGERIWGAVGEDGIYPAETNLTEALPPEVLPRGQQVYVNVTYVGEDGYVTEAGQARFDKSGNVTAGPVPPAKERFERPVPVKHQDGDIRPGMLTVEVTDGG